MSDWKDQQFDGFMNRQVELGNEDLPDKSISATAVMPGSFVGDFTITNGSMSSRDFVAGSIGWKIYSNGSVEFNSGIFRADITGATITGGIIRTAASGKRIEITSAGLSIYDTDGDGLGGIFSDEANVIDINNGTNTGGILAGRNNADAPTIQLYNYKQTALSNPGACIYAINDSLSETVYLKNDNASNTKTVIDLKQDGTGGHIRPEPLSSDPTSGAIGDLAVVGASTPALKICTAATPTWVSFLKTGDVTSPQFYMSLLYFEVVSDGDGGTSNSDTQTVTCGFPPKAIIAVLRGVESSNPTNAHDSLHDDNSTVYTSNVSFWKEDSYQGFEVRRDVDGNLTIYESTTYLYEYGINASETIRISVSAYNATSVNIRVASSKGVGWANINATVSLMIFG